MRATGRYLLIISTAAVVLLLVVAAVEIGFCVNAFHAPLGGCFASVLENFARAPERIVALGLAAVGVLAGVHLMKLGR
jgi:hypothetical protein